MRQIRDERGDITARDIEALYKELAAILQEGLAFDDKEIYAGVRCVAAPIFGCSGDIVATVGCSMPTARIAPDLSEPLLREVSRTAATISRVMGVPVRAFAPPLRTMMQENAGAW